MSDTQGSGGGAAWRNNPYSGPYTTDAQSDLALYSGVLTRRFVAFLIDLFVLSVPIVLVSIFILLFGVVTLGLGWALFWLVSPFSIIWALFYYGLSLGGPHAATIGMRTLGIHMEMLNGGRPYFLLGVAHAVAYWVSVSFLTPLIVLVGFFNRRGQLLHDLVLGTVLVNTAATMPPSRSF
ncbi:MAG: RDD family protein [Bradyrhizobiaceae bacterium]|uniref:RDD family protein n=1 Tax=Afipia sp. 1NLS2 TaxID=666684 RepID=UPI0001D9EC86|nr:RDD family protein [Afipia sp. 1NLS2]EFI50273.1 RDD domain containing protein [Afipia sp. 1NLS2]RTL76934.1 MAG: RDD family protein [Bradyrhizobiaceae bacterium]